MKLSIIVVTIFLGAVVYSTQGYAENTCDLAAVVAQKAHKRFQTDKAAGLKLFIKAEALCPEEPVYAYNLGTAYYQYGRLSEAAGYLNKAVAGDPGKAMWQNNLAGVLLALGKGREALTPARAAYKLLPSAPTAETLAQAESAAGNDWDGLATIRKAKKTWSSEKRIAQAYDTLLDRYLTHHLEAVKAGRTRAGLDGLKKVDFDARGVRAYCLALAGTGKLDEAIRAAGEGKTRFTDLSGTFDSLIEKKTRGFYETFRQGRTVPAVKAAKDFSERYPGNEMALKTYNELFDALLADAVTIEVPKPVVVARVAPGAGGRVDDLLTSFDPEIPAAVPASLTVNVDENIPAGRIKRPYGMAVVIGNQRYTRQNRGIKDVAYAERDAAVMKKYLVKTMGFQENNIIYRTNVTSGDFRNIFGSKDNPRGMLHRHIRSGESEVFIYYVGHGAPGPNGTTAYLVPVDAQADYIQNNGYDLDLFYKVVAALSATDVTVVLDACFSGDSAAGPLFSNISPAMLKSV